MVPLQAQQITIATAGSGLPAELPHLSVLQLLTMSRNGPQGARVWHARRNVEMLGGLLLKVLLRKNLKLLFTSASQRKHTGYTKWLISKMDQVIATSAKGAKYPEVPAQVVHHGPARAAAAPPDTPRRVHRARARRLGVSSVCGDNNSKSQ